MLSRIRDDLDARPDPGPWIAAARTISERLIISENAFYYFAELFTECLVFAASGSDPELLRLGSEMEEIERAHGLRDDEFWHLDDAPDAIVASHLRELGNADLADLLEHNRREFDRRTGQGRVDLWGEDDADGAADDSPG
jgi:hypothetical protein